MQPAIRTELNEMLAPLPDLAETMLEETGEFRPFGERLAAGGQPAVIDVAPTMRPPATR
jgi:hypothetical protein